MENSTYNLICICLFLITYIGVGIYLIEQGLFEGAGFWFGGIIFAVILWKGL